MRGSGKGLRDSVILERRMLEWLDARDSDRPFVLFLNLSDAHLPYDPSNAVTHLTAARGFQAKVRALKRIDRWDPSERVPNASKTSSALGGILDSVRTTAGSFAAKMQSTVLEGLG